MTGITQERLDALRERIADIATAMLCDPISQSRSGLRYRRHGSLAIDTDKKVYFDHESSEGGDAIKLIQREMGLDFRAAVVAGEKLLGLHGAAAGAVPQKARRRYNSAKAAKPKPRGISRKADAVWGAALRLDGSMGGRYLEENRRCGNPGNHCCRFVPALKHILSSRIFPCIASLVTDAVTGAPLTLHMTFLALDGRAKAPVEPSRLFWPGLPVGGGVVRLSADDEVETGLAISESLEDGQSLVDHGVRPVWACLSAGAMANFPVLAGVEALTICPDADDAGRRAAAKCMERWTAAGREVTVTFPFGTAKDFNEAAVTRAGS